MIGVTMRLTLNLRTCGVNEISNNRCQTVRHFTTKVMAGTSYMQLAVGDLARQHWTRNSDTSFSV